MNFSLSFRSFLAFSLLLVAGRGLGLGQLRPADPGESVLSNCSWTSSYTWDSGSGLGPIEGLVFWPTQCGDPHRLPLGVRDLVVIVHGDGDTLADHEELGQHLARNGFIVASVGAGLSSNDSRTAKVLDYLDFLKNQWTHQHHLTNRLVLIGHSRGGEAVLTTARQLFESQSLLKVEAVVSLAPTDNVEGTGNSHGHENLSGLHSPAYLVMYGSSDSDVSGYCLESSNPSQPACGIFPPNAGRTGFDLYDRAGHESSSEGVLSDLGGVTKAMIFADNKGHNAWTDAGGIEGKHMTRSYVTAFLQWRLFGWEKYQRFFTGEWTPAEFFRRPRQQYSEKTRRRVVDNFENPGLGTGSLGPVTRSSDLVLATKQTLYEHPNHTIPHETDGLVLGWSRQPWSLASWMRWAIPDQTIDGIRMRDVSSFTHLSLRAAVMHGAAANLDQESRSFSLRLEDAHGNRSARVPSDLLTKLDYPHAGSASKILSQTEPPELWQIPNSGLQTVRFPLNYFHGVDLDQVSEITLYLDDPTHFQGEMVFDSLEFVSGGPLGATQIAQNLPVGELALETGERLDYTFEPDDDIFSVTVRVTGGVGDADLYVRQGEIPTLSEYDCRPYLSGNTEQCFIERSNGEPIHVLVRPYRAFSGAVLEVSTSEVPCTDCDLESGLLWGTGDRAYHPNGTYYYAAQGRHEAWLDGYEAADFDLYLYRWTGSSWTIVSSSRSPESYEHVIYDGSPGYYYWMVESYHGSGRYEFYSRLP